MKKFSRCLLFVPTIATLLLSACGGTAATPTANPGSGKIELIPVAFIGVVDSMAGDQWVINGQTVTVSPDVIRDGPFNIGDQVKVEGIVNTDGSFTISRVESPTPQDSSSLPQFGNDNSNDVNANDVNSNDTNSNDDTNSSANTNDASSNDDNGNDLNSNDDNGTSVDSNDDNGGNDNSDDDNGGDDDNNGNGNGG